MLGAIYSLMVKDLRLLARDRGAVFLTFLWPLVLATFFGALGPGFGAALEHDADASGGVIKVLSIDEDRSEASASLLAELDADPLIELEASDLADAEERVRLGTAPAYVRIEAGFGAAPSPALAPGLPRPEQPTPGSLRGVEIGVDPRRGPETQVLAGATRLAAWRALAREQSQGEPEPGTTTLEAVALSYTPVRSSAAASRPPTPYAVTFPQGIIWAVLACAATFAVSLVEERKRGTLLRLAVAPVPRLAILLGKASACLVAIVIMQLVLLSVAVIGFGVRPTSWALLALALAATALGFVGLMTLLAVIGRRTQSAAGMSWAVLMSMAMVGGGMLPLFLMPSWLQVVANASPVAWALLAIEGAVWRGFSPAQMLLPCAGLVGLGVGSLVIGARAVREL